MYVLPFVRYGFLLLGESGGSKGATDKSNTMSVSEMWLFSKFKHKPKVFLNAPYRCKTVFAFQTRLAALASKLSRTIKPNLETPTASLMMPGDPNKNPDSGDANAVRRREETRQMEKSRAINAAEETPEFLASIADDTQVAPEMPKSKITSCLQS